MSIRLTQFSFCKKDSGLFRRPRAESYTTKNSKSEPMHLQIWTDREIDNDIMINTESSAPPEIRLAILSSSHLYLIKGNYCNIR
jgi:hypothetical protein